MGSITILGSAPIRGMWEDITFSGDGGRSAYIRDGLNDGDEVVITTLATVAEGAGLRKVSDSPQQGANGSEEPAE